MSRAIKGRAVSGDGPQERSFRALIRAMGLLDRVMQPYFTKFGLSGAKWGTLRALHRAQQEGHQGLRMTELSERLLVRPPSVTGVIDRLERSGWVTRDAAPDDLRAKQVRLTPEGRCPKCSYQVPGRWAPEFDGQIASRPFLPHNRSRLFTITGR